MSHPKLGGASDFPPDLGGNREGGTFCQTSVEISLYYLTVAHRNDSFFMASPKFLSPRAESRGLYSQIAISYPILAFT